MLYPLSYQGVTAFYANMPGMNKPAQESAGRIRHSPQKLPRTVIVLGLVSFFNDFASDIVIPLIPVLIGRNDYFAAWAPTGIGTVETVAALGDAESEQGNDLYWGYGQLADSLGGESLMLIGRVGSLRGAAVADLGMAREKILIQQKINAESMVSSPTHHL